MISNEDRKFFLALGERVAQLRKEAGLTQVQLAELLDISQQHVASFEAGRRRVPVSLLPVLARTLSVPIDALLGERPPTGSRRGPTPRLLQQLERISRLPRAKQRIVMEMLDGVLSQAGQ